MSALPSFENLRYEKKSQIAFITIARPKVLNALNIATLRELSLAFQAVRDDDDVRIAILTGEGEKAFVAGADITELAKLGPIDAEAFAVRGQAVFSLIENCGKPVIAAVNGFALGGGCELALACTMRLASENARFGQPESKLGIIPGYGGTQRLPRLVGKGLAFQIILSGEMLRAEEAYRIGLVNAVLPPAELLPHAEALAQRIIANAPIATRFCLEAVNKGMEMTLSEGLAYEASLFGLCCATEDKNEGTRAFLEKRVPQFHSN
ncbi:MAG TPA: enoyl-CoA hydratase-related protein [Candidatus Saccharimonadales bacterium]|nr:enoyl-CoA hydratase-related protein [Candidatus Saccharimonadales bacterium]